MKKVEKEINERLNLEMNMLQLCLFELNYISDYYTKLEWNTN